MAILQILIYNNYCFYFQNIWIQCWIRRIVSPGLTDLWEKFIAESIARLRVTANPEQALATADLVVESVTENLELKKKLFASYDKVAPAKTIFASNTSSLAIRNEISTNIIRQYGVLKKIWNWN